MISRSRSGPTVAAMSIDCTTSANSNVTCLYSANRLTCVTAAPHSLQNLAFGGSSVPHEPHDGAVAGRAPRSSPTPPSFHCRSAGSQCYAKLISITHWAAISERRELHQCIATRSQMHTYPYITGHIDLSDH